MRADGHGEARLVLRGCDFGGYLQLAVCEIMSYGGSPLQIRRRPRVMLQNLLDALPSRQRLLLQAQSTLLQEPVERAFTVPGRRAIARGADLQGVGGGSPL
ncbi:hypothetical protein ACIPJS_15530 [Streptomyces sp. NPDC086783]|uniref:hypothetical protein n=1 Tax=Streptomyces sp. NPDC086783 TaxID=3365758 RepID=UPI00382B1D7E